MLSGEMEESGFAERQWMVQRKGQFIHLTELLYHVVEQIDGQRTLDEIAARMSEAIDRDVTADNVRQLIGSKLIPLGIVVGADGKVVGADATGEGIARSPLKINMKTKILPRGLITPLTAVLKILFFPPILIAMLIACAVAQGWLFFVHGIAGSIHDAVYKPWLTLVLLGIIIVGTAWHEFGHASALEYGGGKVRGMGAGFYLVYPAFYTDVTDNYRLGRWARVRTDLGGFYFNLIFCLGLIALYFLTGQSFLLLGVLLIDVDILHQCLPFVRLDGYWTLADITGIPDFFSYMGPFLRSVLPIKRHEGDDELPELKRWVKILFALYIVVTIPVLAFLLFVMIKNVPRILASAWDSLSNQGGTLSSAWSGGQYGSAAAAGAQMLLLALPIAGLAFTLYSLGRKGLTLLWNWSKPTPARRAVGTLATAALAALLVFLWVPNLPSISVRKGGPNPFAVQNNWTPIAANERGTVFDALPPVLPNPFDSGVTAPTAAPDRTATAAAGTATPNGTPVPTSTPAPAPTATQPPQAPMSPPVVLSTPPPPPITNPPVSTAVVPVATVAPPATAPTQVSTPLPAGTAPASTARATPVTTPVPGVQIGPTPTPTP